MSGEFDKAKGIPDEAKEILEIKSTRAKINSLKSGVESGNKRIKRLVSDAKRDSNLSRYGMRGELTGLREAADGLAEVPNNIEKLIKIIDILNQRITQLENQRITQLENQLSSK